LFDLTFISTEDAVAVLVEMIIIGVALAAFWSSGSIAVICPSVGQYFKISSPICFVRHILFLYCISPATAEATGILITDGSLKPWIMLC
jgi:hypothetical protein